MGKPKDRLPVLPLQVPGGVLVAENFRSIFPGGCHVPPSSTSFAIRHLDAGE